MVLAEEKDYRYSVVHLALQNVQHKQQQNDLLNHFNFFRNSKTLLYLTIDKYALLFPSEYD
jgi:hypothetical protein